MPKVFTLYLSTQTPGSIGTPGVPIDSTNKAQVRWSINWDQLYGAQKNDIENQIARVTFQLTTLSQSGIYTYADNSGVLAIQGLSNKWSNPNNGLILGQVSPLDNPVTAATNHILFGDTLQTRGVTTIMPSGYQDIVILINDRLGALQPNVVDYQLILQFEME